MKSALSDRMKKGVVIEVLGEDVALLDTETNHVHILPSEFSSTVHALAAGGGAPDFSQVEELRELGVLESPPRRPVSRREAVFGVGALAGATAASFLLPSTAYAASATFFVSNSTFFWLFNDPNDPSSGFTVDSVADPEPAELFAVGSSWMLTLDLNGGTTESGEVMDFGNRYLGFELEPTIATGDVLRGRLSGPNGALSNQFLISEGADL